MGKQLASTPTQEVPALRLRFAAFQLDEPNARLLREGAPIELPPKAFAVLCALARQPGRLVTKDALLDAVWGHRHVSESVLKTTISQLRAALDDDAKQPRVIETASRRGYRFIAQLRADAAPPVALAGAALAAELDAGPQQQKPTPGALIVGRQSALARLLGHWREAQRGQRQVVWVSGEAGIGKTSLIDALAGSLGDAVCARGQCVEPYGAGEPYLPVLDALGSLCRRDAQLPAMLRSIAPTWLLQMPWLLPEAEREAVQREVAGASQDRMLREMGELLDRYTEDKPLLLITEDLHWSDHATVRLLDHVARRRSLSRLLWLGSFRLAELIAEDHPLKGVRQELRAHRQAQEMVLEALSEREVAEYVERRLAGVSAGEAFVRSLHAHTDGLPLFLVNLVDDLQQRGALPGPGGVTIDDDALDSQHVVPESLAGVIEKQLVRLPEDMQALLAAASVCGMVFRPQTPADALEREPAWAAELCDRLAQRQSWISALGVERRADGTLDATYGFRHALYRQVFYQRIGAVSRAELHYRIGQSLARERTGGLMVAAAELAMHFERGQDLRSAVRFGAEAAGSAMMHFAPLEAVRHAEHALELLPRCPASTERAAIELALLTTRGVAATQLYGVASPEAITTLERARELCDALPASAERIWVLGGLGWIYYTRGRFDDARALAQRVIEHAQASGDRVLELSGCNLMGVTVCYRGHQREARRWLDEGLSICAALTVSIPSGRFVVDPEASMRANLLQPLCLMGLIDDAGAQADAALARAQAIGQPMAFVLAYWCACMLAIRLGEVERVGALAESLAEWVSRHSVAQGDGPSRWYRGWALAASGRPAEGHRLILEGYECHAKLGMYAGCPKVLGYAAEALALQSDWDGAARQIDEALALAHRIGETLELPGLWLTRAQIEGERDRSGEARAALREALSCARSIGAERDAIDALHRLCSRPDAARSDLDALREACKTAPEGFDPGLRSRALALLAAR